MTRALGTEAQRLLALRNDDLFGSSIGDAMYGVNLLAGRNWDDWFSDENGDLN